MTEIVILALACALAAALIASQFLHRQDMRSVVDGLTLFYQGEIREMWNRSRWEVGEQRKEIERLQALVLRLKVRPTSVIQQAPAPPGYQPAQPQNGHRRKELDYATQAGV